MRALDIVIELKLRVLSGRLTLGIGEPGITGVEPESNETSSKETNEEHTNADQSKDSSRKTTLSRGDRGTEADGAAGLVAHVDDVVRRALFRGFKEQKVRITLQ